MVDPAIRPPAHDDPAVGLLVGPASRRPASHDPDPGAVPTAPALAPGPVPLIVGLGLLTPLGDLEQTWEALLAGRFITDHGRVPFAVAARPGESRAGALACLAARAACRLVPAAERTGPDTALVVGTSKGPVDDWLITPSPPPADHIPSKSYVAAGGSRGLLASPPAGLPLAGPRAGGVGEIARHVGDALGLAGPRLTTCAACASGLHALIRACLMIRGGEAGRVLVVAAESSLHPLFLANFKRLGVLAPPEIGCRPFDHSRRGFLVSEAAAAVMLEAWHPGQPPPPRHQPGSFVAVENLALGADAAHLTGSDPEGGTLRRLLSQVLAGRPVNLIHAHGTGTLTNDQIELAAIEAMAGAAQTGQCLPPVVYSHKGALGHSLGAAGLISVVLNCLAHDRGLVPPNIRATDPLATRNVTLSALPTRRPIARSVAMAAGFGGPVAVVALRGYPLTESNAQASLASDGAT